MEILKQELESDPLNRAAILNNLALLYQSKGDYNEAESFYLQAIEVLRKWLGDNYLDIPIDLNKLQNELQRSRIEFPPYNPQVMSVSLNIKLVEIIPNAPKVRQNFLLFLHQVVQENRIEELSDHPVTRSMLDQLRQG